MENMKNDDKSDKDAKGVWTELYGGNIILMEDILNQGMQRKVKVSMKVILIHD